eukprot:1165987-Prorocentrum_minimum.AAC.1
MPPSGAPFGHFWLHPLLPRACSSSSLRLLPNPLRSRPVNAGVSDPLRIGNNHSAVSSRRTVAYVISKGDAADGRGDW